MSPKKSEPQFKLNYFDIIKGVLFPNAGKPTLKAPPAAQKPAQQAYAQPSSPIQGDVPLHTPKPASPPPPKPSTSQPFQPAASQPIAVVPTRTADQKPAAKSSAGPKKALIKRDKLAPAFFNTVGILSFIVNIILIVVLVILARELFALKALVGDHLLGGLYANFILMDKAHIRTNIVVEDSIPIQFDLPIDQAIIVTLNEPTRINGAQVVINSGGLSINAPANIVLPAGTQLPIQLNLTVPVQTTVPIKINVPVDIPLQETELHQPFIGLQDVVRPLYELLQPKIKSPDDLPCGVLNPACNSFFITP
jgi:hypothetical protein